MKLMKREEYEKAVDALVSEINETEKDYTLSVKKNFKKEESNGSIFFAFTFKKNGKGKATDSKTGLYIFESRKSICSFIVNGRTMDMLFENSTINSPDIALHYLKDILLSEVSWIKEFDKKMEESTQKKKKNFRGGKPSFERDFKPGQNRNGSRPSGVKKSVVYSSGKDNRFSKDSSKSGKYSEGHHGNNSGYKGSNSGYRKSSSTYNIKTSKNPYQK